MVDPNVRNVSFILQTQLQLKPEHSENAVIRGRLRSKVTAKVGVGRLQVAKLLMLKAHRYSLGL